MVQSILAYTLICSRHGAACPLGLGNHYLPRCSGFENKPKSIPYLIVGDNVGYSYPRPLVTGRAVGQVSLLDECLGIVLHIFSSDCLLAAYPSFRNIPDEVALYKSIGTYSGR